jgi:hypothetical protein
VGNAAKHPAVVTTVFYVPETLRFGFRCAFEGRPPHYVIATCLTMQDALDHCDPHRDCVWEEPSDANENALLVSREYKEGSVMWRMANFTLAELASRREAANR